MLTLQNADRMIAALQNCVVACEQCITEAGDVTARDGAPVNGFPQCCHELADMCELMVKAIVWQSRWMARYAALCAAVSEWCAMECMNHPSEATRRCADFCRACAVECWSVAASDR